MAKDLEDLGPVMTFIFVLGMFVAVGVAYFFVSALVHYLW